MDKEGIKKEQQLIGGTKVGLWRTIDEIPYKELSRVWMTLEEMRLEELDDVKEYIRDELRQRVKSINKDSPLGRYYIRKHKSSLDDTKELYHVTNVIDDKIYIGDTLTIEIQTSNYSNPVGVTVRNMRIETQIFDSSNYWKIKGKNVSYEPGDKTNLVVFEITEDQFIEAWTFAKQLIQIYGKL